MGHSQLKPMQANNPEDLVSCIKWVSTAVLKYVSAPPAFPEESTITIPRLAEGHEGRDPVW